MENAIEYDLVNKRNKVFHAANMRFYPPKNLELIHLWTDPLKNILPLMEERTKIAQRMIRVSQEGEEWKELEGMYDYINKQIELVLGL